ncbi:MAG: crossover junction endodeoxyribonuclease RuvC [Candidatus Gracilibacteria bacterium]|nr:crossover junction endodeoxyribonuclease RuvC [Candidatus Gracilibacteria bacterium]
MIILGIDPGTTTTGFAITKKEGIKISLIEYGILKTIPKISIDLKLLEIGTDIRTLIDKFAPDLVAIEKLYFTNNIKTGIDVAESRGVIIYESMRNNIQIQEYTPLEVKKAITGNGKATKIQMQNAIKILFQLNEIPKPDDVADAIGISYIGALNLRTL